MNREQPDYLESWAVAKFAAIREAHDGQKYEPDFRTVIGCLKAKKSALEVGNAPRASKAQWWRRKAA